MEYRAGSGQIRNVVAFVISCSFTNQVLAQLDVLKKWEEAETYNNDVYLQSKEIHGKVVKLHVLALNAKLPLSEQGGCYRWHRVGLCTPTIQNGVPRSDRHRGKMVHRVTKDVTDRSDASYHVPCSPWTLHW